MNSFAPYQCAVVPAHPISGLPEIGIFDAHIG